MPFQWDIANVVGSNVDEDGFGEIQHDAYGEEESGVPAYEQHHPFGSWGRPLDPVVGDDGQPDPSQSCAVLVAQEGGKGHAIALGDPRVTNKLIPAPAKGEHVTYNAFGAFHRLKADGSLWQCTTTTGGGLDGHAVAAAVTPTSFQRYAPWGREKWDATGYRLKFGGTDGGGKFTLGYNAGEYYARIQADAVEINASEVSIGPDGALPQPVAQAQPLVTVLQTLVAALEAVAASIATASALTVTSGVTPAQSTLLAGAVAAAQTAVSGALETISTQTQIG